MSAVFLPLGTTHVLFRARGPTDFLYLGTSVTSPTVETEVVRLPVTTDLANPVQTNSIYKGEVHTVSVVLNRLDYSSYGMVKNGGDGLLRREDTTKESGQLTVPVHDLELLLLFDVPQPTAGFVPLGRMYYSVEPVAFRETTENSRLLEAGIVFKCFPLPRLLPVDAPKKPASLYNREEYELLLNPLLQERNDFQPAVLFGIKTLISAVKEGATKPGCPLRRGKRVLSLFSEDPEDWLRE